MSTFTDKAKLLVKQGATSFAAIAAIGAGGLTIADTASAGIINSTDLDLDSSHVGFWASSGRFSRAFSGVSDLPPICTDEDKTFCEGAPRGQGYIRQEKLGDGLKLYGEASMYGVGVDRNPEGVQGMAFMWTGDTRALSAGDFLSLDYEFDIDLDSDNSISWLLQAALVPESWGKPVAANGEYTYYNSAITPGYGTAENGHTGVNGATQTAAVDVAGNYHWAVVLSFQWQAPSSELDMNDYLHVTIPDHSIDVGVNVTPTGDISEVPEPSHLALLGLSFASLSLARRGRRRSNAGK
ncbi:PEP-CTERM sorting domain-containing protein [Hahella sp. CR1]|uniref:PEP-CTERM sorting domain-containing protein n=1 Tax=Hahella sp. CR1 TaxID=2992807 RepID=UPI0024410732|nr:PEP-CTERM sorting domain-containing protein [Hahella sp. CR1]MDG9669519.1 PEP-CTERM sorting domain-containing protein [Hahella sp. CR1]